MQQAVSLVFYKFYFNLFNNLWSSVVYLSSNSFSVPAFESLIIVATNSVSEKSLSELNKRVRDFLIVDISHY